MAERGKGFDKLEITYPLNETVFPPEIAEPTFRWRDEHVEADTWLVRVEFANGKEPLMALSHAIQWTPSPEQWHELTARSVKSPAKVTIVGVKQAAPRRILSFGTISISTCKDEVGAPLFFREVNLPFEMAVTDPAKYICWRFGPISSREPPPVILDHLPVCANCHSFSADGKQFGMDVDYANDKGSYVLSAVEQQIVMEPGKIITWNDFRRGDGQLTRGLLSRLSPDGRYAVSTVKDRSIFLPKDNLEYSQLFFPIKGILAVFDRQNKTFSSLPGADDPQYVQSNPIWSPDGKYIVFAKSRSEAIETEGATKNRGVFSSREEAVQFLAGERSFLYDLYRIPFNDGKGGTAEPIPGASNNGMSNYFAKFSPDGKWIVFCQAKSFMLLQPDSQLYIIPAAGGEARRLRCNTSRMNSWHSWSPNGKWLVFSSKLNGPYTQLMLTHIDEEGNSTPPVVLDRLSTPQRAVNIPEFVSQPANAIQKICEQFLDDHSHVRAGDAFLNAGDLKNTERMYRMAVKINPRSCEARCSLAQVLMQLNQSQEAFEHLQVEMEIDPKAAEEHFNLGVALADLRKFLEAIAHYELAIHAKPDYVKAHYNLALILCEVGRVPEAIAHYKQVVQLEPKNAYAHSNLGTALVSMDKLQDAVAHYQQAVEAEPDEPRFRSNLNQALAMAEQTAAAIRQYEEAVKQDPNSAELQSKLGDALMKADRVPEAITHFEQALQLSPNDAEAHNSLAWLLATREHGLGGDPAKAVSLAQRACVLTENKSAECLDTLAAAYAAARQFPEAITAAEKAIELATAEGRIPLATRIEAHLEHYRAGRAYDEAALPVRQPTP